MTQPIDFILNPVTFTSIQNSRQSQGSGIVTVGFGDSLIDRNFLSSATENSYLNYGYIHVINMLLGQPFRLVYNGGVVGDTTTQMLARIGTALAYRPRVAFINAGTNDIYGSGDATSVITPRLKQIFDMFLAIGCEVHYNLQAPRTFTATADVAKVLRVNEWAQNYARTVDGLICHPIQDATGFLNAASTQFIPIAGNLETASSVHWNSYAAFNIGTLIAGRLSGKYQKGQRLISSAADCIQVDATSNQLFQYGVMNDSGSPAGTKTNTGAGTAPTGTVADGFDVDHTVNTTGTCVASVASRTDGIGKDLVLTIGAGVTAGANDKWLVRTQGNMSTGVVAGGTYQAECDVQVSSPVKLTSLSFWVQAAVDGGSVLSYYFNRHSSDPVDYPSTFAGGSYRTPEFTLPSGTTVTTFHLRWEARFTTAGGSAVIKIGRVSVRRIVD